MVIRERLVVRIEIERVEHVAIAVTVGGTAVASTEHLTEGEVGEGEEVARLLLSRDLQRIVVGEPSMLIELDLLIVFQRPIVVRSECGTTGWASRRAIRCRIDQDSCLRVGLEEGSHRDWVR